MGCFWSSEQDEKCLRCHRRAVNHLVIINNVCEVCISDATRRERALSAPPRLLYGEYRCQCGRHWVSYRSWKNRYQICERCNRQVHAYMQRELLPSDMSSLKDNKVEHKKELCQMCQQLGHYCGNFNGSKTYHNSRSRMMKSL